MWTIQEQTEKKGKTEINVLCKHVQFFPKEDARGNVEGFGKIKPIVLRIVLQNEKGYQLKLTMSADSDSYTITHPEKEVAPTFTTGTGKNRREHYDYLAPGPKKVSEKEKYPYAMDFEQRCKALFGEDLKNEIMELFAMKLGYLTKVPA